MRTPAAASKGAPRAMSNKMKPITARSPNTSGVCEARDRWRSWFSAAAPPTKLPVGRTSRIRSMVDPVAGVEGPVLGTTWSRVHPARVAPGATAATPAVWSRVASATCW